MADSFITIVPSDPFADPGEARLASVARWLRRHGYGDEIEVETHELPEFYHGFHNLDSKHCPECNANLEQWWAERMGLDFDRKRRGFLLIAATVPCCGASVNLNQLVYKWPAAFGVCAVTARNWRARRWVRKWRGEGLAPADLARLTSLLGCKFTLVLGHM